MTREGVAAIPREEGTMDEPVRNWQEWAEQHSEAAAERDRYGHVMHFNPAGFAHCIYCRASEAETERPA